MTDAPVRSDDDFLVFGKPAIEQPEIDEVVDSIESGWLGTGPKVDRFEDQFAEYVGADHALALNSCTAALHLSLEVLDLEPGDEVVTTALTFCASVNSIIHAGGTPVLADVDAETMNIDPWSIERAITDDTVAIMPVHFAGRPANMGAIEDLADAHDLTVVEDAAHAIETEWRGTSAGTLGDFGCFSFYATKNVATGEGGMLTCEDPEIVRRLRRLSLHGMSRDAWGRYSSDGYSHYEVVEPGYKYNMIDLQAALGIHQLDRVDRNWERRCKIWASYQEAFDELPVRTPAPVADEHRHARHLYTILIDEQRAGLSRDEFIDGLQEHNIGAGVHYPSLPEYPYYREQFGWDPADYPDARRIGRRTVSLPIAPNLDDGDVADVIEASRRLLT
ncbi:MAG: DegT/DnrJ/EryC1/StrS family aminotransferase [Bradymonadaceae bacterium]